MCELHSFFENKFFRYKNKKVDLFLLKLKIN